MPETVLQKAKPSGVVLSFISQFKGKTVCVWKGRRQGVGQEKGC